MKLRVEHVALRHLLALGASDEASSLVRAIVRDVVAGLRETLAGMLAATDADAVTRAHRRAALAEIDAFTASPAPFREPRTLPPPPGTPI